MATLTEKKRPGAAADDRREAWVTDFETFRAERSTAEPGALGDLRRAAIDRFADTGFPTLRWEEWRKTDVRPISQGEFARATAAGAVSDAHLAPHLFEGAVRLVFVDGFLSPEHSRLDGLPEGAFVGSLAAALEAEPERVERHLGGYAKFDDHPFVALNTAFFTDGAFVHIPRGTVVETPIHLVYLTTVADGTPVAAFPRNLLWAGENSQLTLVETYGGAGEGRYLNCPVTEVVSEQAAVVDHYKVNHEARDAYHMATLQVYQLRDSNFFSHSISAGGAITRNDVNAFLDDTGVECTLNGLYMVNGEQLVDNHMRMDHAKPHCNSYELYKGVLDDKARSVFNGRIYVHPDAQKTDAKQSNRNLLLSRGALASSNPQLEIFADDVKCTHGSTVGQLDEEAVFYLRSRGIGEEAAKSLLTYAFASDIVNRISVEPLRRDLEEFLFERLPRGEIVRQAV